MCKVLMITNIKHVDKTVEFVKLMGEKMSAYNSDGLGYAALSSSNKLFGERWFKNDKAFKPRKTTLSNPFGDAVSMKDSNPYSSFGDIDLQNVKSILLHTRMATCDKTLANVHPFVKEDTALIHNGVVRNPETYKPTISTCDSEALLNGYLEYDVGKNPEELQSMISPLAGYWAVGLYTKVDNTWILDIFKQGASLDVLYIHELEVWVFATNSYDVEEVCTKLGYKCSEKGEVHSNTHIRMNPLTGEVIFSKLLTVEKPPVTRTAFAEDYKGTRPYSSWEKEEPEIEVYDGKSFSEYVMKNKRFKY